MKIPQCDALLALFETMKSRGRKADLLGELGISHVAALLTEKIAELFFERVMHAPMLANCSFRLWNKTVDRLAVPEKLFAENGELGWERE